MGEPSYWVLCANCGTVLPEEKLLALRADDDGVLGLAPDGWFHPVGLRCAACGHDHVDDDSNPGLYMGSRVEMEVERATLAQDEVWRDAWATAWEEIEEAPGPVVLCGKCGCHVAVPARPVQPDHGPGEPIEERAAIAAFGSGLGPGDDVLRLWEQLKAEPSVCDGWRQVARAVLGVVRDG